MNITQTIRQINIAIIFDKYHPILDWFNTLWDQLYVLETDIHHKNGDEIIYYTITQDDAGENVKNTIFFRDEDKDIFYVSYNKYWKIMRNRFNMDETAIECITKVLLDKILNTNIKNMNTMTFVSYEIILRNDINTPIRWNNNI